MNIRTTQRRRFFAILMLFLLCIGMTLSLVGCQKAEPTKEITCVDDLAGSRIGVQLGTTGDIYATDYEKDNSGTTLERYSKSTDAIQALKQHKVDCIIIDEQPAKSFIEKNPELTIIEEAFAVEEYAICVKKGNDALCADINTALAKLKADGTLDTIIKNYTGSDEEKGNYPYQIKEVERNNGTLTVATNAVFKPYEYYDNGKITGLDMDMIQAVCDELGMTLKIEDMDFDAIINAVHSGKADVGVAGMTVTADRLKNINFTDSYTTSKQVIIVNAGTPQSSGTFIEQFKNNFIKDGRYQYILKGLGNTLIITIFALIIGTMLGFLIAVIRTSHDRNGGLTILNALCKVYVTIIRGTPAVVQLLIIYYVIFSSVDIHKIIVAVISFGLNSAAYVSEVVRSGIMAVDQGQFEAGRSLGLSYNQTMISIILPQAFKNILPALCNEFISLLKETSISGYIGLVDLTKGGDIIRSTTYEAFMPLIAVALIYLVIVMTLTAGVNALERRLRNNERK